MSGFPFSYISCILILINQFPALLVKSTLQEQNKIIILISQCRNVFFLITIEHYVFSLHFIYILPYQKFLFCDMSA